MRTPHLPDNPTASTGRCPLIREPLPQCYCYDSSSANIEAMIRYCGGDYHQCRIYLRILPTSTSLPRRQP
ncbi:hypothetical protein [Geoalkalibacter halelectricus]|uniref:hypothetical protein n=1 Tax=Geoalkalibacter halelectricus TaxID=2847045 RepID=UPI003D1AC97D